MNPALRSFLIEMSIVGSVEELWAMHCEKMASYGFERLLYGFTRYRTERSLGDPNDFVILSTHSRDYTEGFVQDGLYQHAPMLQWSLNNVGAQSWGLFAKFDPSTLPDSTKKVISFNQSHDVTAGYTISFKAATKRDKAAISLAANAGISQEQADAIWQAEGEDLVLINTMMHLKLLSLPVTLPNQELTARQREVLEWVGDGKTMADIAQIMTLTQATVEKHLRLARETLNVDTTAQAVAKAAFRNQMHILQA